jgi:endonuclease III
MPRESREAKSARARRVVEKLDRAMPEARIALEYENELQLLVAVMLSAQTTDAVVNTVTPELFAKYRTAQDYARAKVPQLEKAIRRIGLYRGKARNLHAAMQRIAREYEGKLPRTREELYALPGVGWKTAGVVVNHAFGTPALPVDTHVGRVSRRLGFTRQEDPDKVEAELSALLPPEKWGRAHQLLIWHGRRTCIARKPHCSRCVVAQECPRIGVVTSD